MDKEIISGILLIQKGSGLVKKLQKRYAALYKRSAHGVSRIELYDSKENFDKRVKGAKKHLISLESCATITRNRLNEGKKPEFVIHMTLNDNKEQVLQTETDKDMELWYSSISNVIFGGGADLMDNVIYQQYENEGYEVTIKQNEVVSRLDLHGTYSLCVSSEDVELRDRSTKHVVAKWPLQLLRKYGRDKQEFSLEAGRRCPTGPGMFYFITDHYNAIFQDVDSKVRNLAERGRAHSTSSVKGGPSPTFIPPESPIFPSPASPQPPLEQSLYDDPLDMRKNKPTVEESIYNEPVNSQPSRKQRASVNKMQSSPKHSKPDKAKSTGNGKVQSSSKPKPNPVPKPDRAWQPFQSGAKKDKKGKKPKNLPPSPIPPPATHIEDATYAEALPVAGSHIVADDDYGKLDFDGRNVRNSGGSPENAYDSLTVEWSGGNKQAGTQPDTDYASAADIHNRFRGLAASEEESMYDKVKR